MPGSALKRRGLAQQPPGACVDVVREILRRDATLDTVHKGVVRIAGRIDVFDHRDAWSFIVGSRGFATMERKLGADVEALEVFVEVRWPEGEEERKLGQAGIADLVWAIKRALKGNEKLVWDASWDPPPAGSFAQSNVEHAKHGVITYRPAVHGESMPRDGKKKPVKGPCRMVELMVIVYGVHMSLCPPGP